MTNEWFFTSLMTLGNIPSLWLSVVMTSVLQTVYKPPAQNVSSRGTWTTLRRRKDSLSSSPDIPSFLVSWKVGVNERRLSFSNASFNKISFGVWNASLPFSSNEVVRSDISFPRLQMRASAAIISSNTGPRFFR